MKLTVLKEFLSCDTVWVYLGNKGHRRSEYIHVNDGRREVGVVVAYIYLRLNNGKIHLVLAEDPNTPACFPAVQSPSL